MHCKVSYDDGVGNGGNQRQMTNQRSVKVRDCNQEWDDGELVGQQPLQDPEGCLANFSK